MITVCDQHLHSQHLLHFGTPQIHILDASLSLYPWEHRHSLKQKEERLYMGSLISRLKEYSNQKKKH